MSSISKYNIRNFSEGIKRKPRIVSCILLRNGSVVDVTDEVVIREIGVLRRAVENGLVLNMLKYYPAYVMRIVENVRSLAEGGLEAAVNIFKTMSECDLNWMRYLAHEMDCPVVLNALEAYDEFIEHAMYTNQRIEKWLEDSMTVERVLNTENLFEE